jgi:two-component system, LuxR family, response regulator FixJ
MIVSLNHLPQHLPKAAAMEERGIVHILAEDVEFRRIAAEWAALLGHQPIVHESVGSVVEAARGSRPACLVLGLTFGGTDGLEVQAQILRQKNAAPVVFVTDRAEARWAIRAMKQGAVNVLEKQCDREQFCQAVGDAIARDAIVHRLRDRYESLRHRFADLTERERLVINLVVEGRLNKAIARELQMTERTVERVRAVVLDKVGANSAVQMASLLTEHRLLGELLLDDNTTAGD